MLGLLIGFMVGGLLIYLFHDRIKWDSFKKKEIKYVDKPTVIQELVYKNSKGYEFARKKILDLQNQLAKHETGVQSLHPTDVIRYRAMVEVLTQVLEINE